MSHGSQTPDKGIHGPISWTFANAADRISFTVLTGIPFNSAGLTSTDLYKLSLQIDNLSIWMLTSISPITWTQNSGSQGSPGVTGPAGPQGSPGVTGATGPVGPKGNTGANGAQGSPGVTGPIGAQGIPGVTGATGPVGSQGVTGPAGAQGTQGSPGVTGPQGPQGSPGPTGTAGRTGATGVQGIQGSPGVTGATGPIGPAGPTGTAGRTGATGVQGIQGSPGVTGATGPVGPQGPTGAGVSGFQFYNNGGTPLTKELNIRPIGRLNAIDSPPFTILSVTDPSLSLVLAAGNTTSGHSINVNSGDVIYSDNNSNITIVSPEVTSGGAGNIIVQGSNLNLSGDINTGSIVTVGGVTSGEGGRPVGGAVTIFAGNGLTSPSDGGSITISSGNATNGHAGSIDIVAGTGNDSGNITVRTFAGDIIFSTNSTEVLRITLDNKIKFPTLAGVGTAVAGLSASGTVFRAVGGGGAGTTGPAGPQGSPGVTGPAGPTGPVGPVYGLPFSAVATATSNAVITVATMPVVREQTLDIVFNAYGTINAGVTGPSGYYNRKSSTSWWLPTGASAVTQIGLDNGPPATTNISQFAANGLTLTNVGAGLTMAPIASGIAISWVGASGFNSAVQLAGFTSNTSIVRPT